jgi:hypothetical protein
MLYQVAGSHSHGAALVTDVVLAILALGYIIAGATVQKHQAKQQRDCLFNGLPRDSQGRHFRLALLQ